MIWCPHITSLTPNASRTMSLYRSLLARLRSFSQVPSIRSPLGVSQDGMGLSPDCQYNVEQHVVTRVFNGADADNQCTHRKRFPGACFPACARLAWRWQAFPCLDDQIE